MSDPAPEDIEVGETGSSLRYWLAKEAVRQAELHLAAQAASITAMESRATSILGWSVAGVFVLGSGALSGQFRAPAAVAAALLFISAVLCVTGLWPRMWGVSGHAAPLDIMHSSADTELNFLEQLAEKYHVTIEHNNKRLDKFKTFLSISWVSFVISPIIAGSLTYAIIFWVS